MQHRVGAEGPGGGEGGGRGPRRGRRGHGGGRGRARGRGGRTGAARPCYSVFRLLAGFARAARIDWKLMVKKVSKMMKAAARAKMPGPMSMR
jgi:hypothetical protein